MNFLDFEGHVFKVKVARRSDVKNVGIPCLLLLLIVIIKIISVA